MGDFGIGYLVMVFYEIILVGVESNMKLLEVY